MTGLACIDDQVRSNTASCDARDLTEDVSLVYDVEGVLVRLDSLELQMLIHKNIFMETSYSGAAVADSWVAGKGRAMEQRKLNSALLLFIYFISIYEITALNKPQ